MNLLIVESGAKAKTIRKALGPGWEVVATGGHICDLPSRGDDPKQARKAYWSHRPGELPKPPWSLTERGKKAIERIRAIIEDKGVDKVFIASDPDREGERIAWHLRQALEDVPTARVTFHEVTPEAIRRAVDNPGEIDQDLVDAALVRVFLDRLVGFRGSKMARGVVGRKASMGRVQTPTLGFVVERELEREAHVPVPYFEVRALTPIVALSARFHDKDDPDRWEDENGRYDGNRTSNRQLAEAVHAAVASAGAVTVTDVTRRERQDRPRPPFTTDALLQAAGSRWGWSPKATMGAASALYEAGHITYLRTDSTRLADSAVADARRVVAATWGDDHLGPGVGGAGGTHVQDAHEAIRPTRLDVALPDGVDDGARRLYALIRARTLASQMAPAVRVSLSIRASVEGTTVPFTGSVGWYAFAGWRAAFEPVDGAVDREEVAIAVGDRLELSDTDGDTPNPELREGQTQPPPRYRPHTLVRAMKEAGIGRPSTYASTQDKLLEHGLIAEEGGALLPTEAGRAVWLKAAPLYQLPGDRPVFAVDYTAAMEQALDDIAAGAADAPSTWERFLDAFRTAHETAQELRRSGGATPKQQAMLRALAQNAEGVEVAEIDGLSFEEAQARIAELRDAGVEPAPSDAQMAYLQRLLDKVGLTVAEAAAWAGLGPMTEVTTRAQASALIDALQQHPASSRPSSKQLRWIADLVEKAGLSEAEACALVGVGSFDELSGGRGGTASALIDALKKRAKG